jgi:hypothetical protein
MHVHESRAGRSVGLRGHALPPPPPRHDMHHATMHECRGNFLLERRGAAPRGGQQDAPQPADLHDVERERRQAFHDGRERQGVGWLQEEWGVARRESMADGGWLKREAQRLDFEVVCAEEEEEEEDPSLP